MKHASSLLLTAGVAAAQSTTVVSAFLPALWDASMAASVVSAGPTATDYMLSCPSDTPDEECGMTDGIAILYGPSTMTYDVSWAGHSSVPPLFPTVIPSLRGRTADEA